MIKKQLREVVEYNHDEAKGMRDAVAFEYEGALIIDPFVDETGRFKVDPVEYYEEHNLIGMIATYAGIKHEKGLQS